MEQGQTDCIVCGTRNVKAASHGLDVYLIDCPNCGQFGLLGRMARPWFPIKPNTLKASILSHAIRKMQRKEALDPAQWPILSLDEIVRIVDGGKLPTPAEQADNFLIWLGDKVEDSGITVDVTYEHLVAIAGARTVEGVWFVVGTLVDKGLVDAGKMTGHQLRIGVNWPLTLTLDGWARYESLKRGASSGRNAFMAMKFGDTILDTVFRDCFKPAVAQTGFDLIKLDENPRAGLIDDRLRVEIRASRFMIADLTHGNLGAYWEAGYAEGLGKPVIYTCEKSVFDKDKTHFDTNHHLTVPWDAANLADAAQRVKDTIRATLPTEAKLTD